jgi:hypothetical protein
MMDSLRKSVMFAEKKNQTDERKKNNVAMLNIFQ